MFSRTLTLPSPLCVMHKFPSHPSWLQSVFSLVKGARQTLLWEVFPAGKVGYLGRSGMSPKPDFCLAWERRNSYSLAGFSLELLAASAWINLDFMVGTSRLTQVTDVAVRLYFKTKKPRVLLQLDAVRLIVFILHAAGKPGGALSPLLTCGFYTTHESLLSSWFRWCLSFGARYLLSQALFPPQGLLWLVSSLSHIMAGVCLCSAARKLLEVSIYKQRDVWDHIWICSQ